MVILETYPFFEMFSKMEMPFCSINGNPTRKIQAFVNTFSANLPLCQNFQCGFSANGTLRQKFGACWAQMDGCAENFGTRVQMGTCTEGFGTCPT